MTARWTCGAHGRKGYVHLARDSVRTVRHAADDAVKTAAGVIEIVDGENAEVLLFDPLAYDFDGRG